MAAQPSAGVRPWTIARIQAEHPTITLRLGQRLCYGAIGDWTQWYANVYVRLETSVVRQPFTWESLIQHLTTKVPLVA
jgi:hypothetical protein